MDRKANGNDNGILTWTHLKDFMGRITHKFYSRDIEVPKGIFVAKQEGSLDQGNQNPYRGTVTIGSYDSNSAQTDVSIYNPKIYGNSSFDNAPMIQDRDLVSYIVDNLGSYSVISLTQDLNNDATNVAETYSQYRSQSFIGRAGDTVNSANYIQIDGFDYTNSSYEGGSNITKDGTLVIKNTYQRQRPTISFKNKNCTNSADAPDWLNINDNADPVNGYYGLSINNICKFIKGKSIGYNVGNFRFAAENDQEDFIDVSSKESTITENTIIDFDNIALDSKYAVYYKIQKLNEDETDVLDVYSLESKELLTGKTGSTVNIQPKTIAGHIIKSPYNTSLTVKGNNNVTENGDVYVAGEGEVSAFEFFYDTNKYIVNWSYKLGEAEYYAGTPTEQYANTFVKTPANKVYVGGSHVTSFNIDGTSYGYNQKTNKKITGETTLEITPTTEVNSYNIIFKPYNETKEQFKHTLNNEVGGNNIISKTMENQARKYGDGLQLPDCGFSSWLYSFKCWNNGFLDVEANSTEDIGGNNSEADVTLTAEWETKQISGTFQLGDIVLSNNENGQIKIKNLPDFPGTLNINVISDYSSSWGLLEETQRNASVMILTNAEINKYININTTEDARVNVYGQIKFMNKENSEYKNITSSNVEGIETGIYTLNEQDVPYTVKEITKNIQIVHYKATGDKDGGITTKIYTFGTDEYFDSDTKFKLNMNYNFGTNTKVYAYSLDKEFDLSQYATFDEATIALAQENKFIDGLEIADGIIYSDKPMIDNLVIVYQNNN